MRDVGKAGKGKQELPKTKCCASKPRCGRCPLRMMKEGTLPEGLTVRHRRLVTAKGKKVGKKDLPKVVRKAAKKTARKQAAKQQGKALPEAA